MRRTDSFSRSMYRHIEKAGLRARATERSKGKECECLLSTPPIGGGRVRTYSFTLEIAVCVTNASEPLCLKRWWLLQHHNV